MIGLMCCQRDRGYKSLASVVAAGACGSHSLSRELAEVYSHGILGCQKYQCSLKHEALLCEHAMENRCSASMSSSPHGHDSLRGGLVNSRGDRNLRKE